MQVLIATFAFGAPAHILPNRILATIAQLEYMRRGGIILTQQDIQFDGGVTVTYIDIDPRKKDPPSTLYLARKIAEYVQSHKEIEEVVIVAALPHVWRVTRDMKMALKEQSLATKITVSEEMNKYTPLQFFDRESTQVRTRSLKDWRVREFILKMLPWPIYKRVAA